MSAERTLLIVYHSQSGTCARLARAALAGAREEPDVRACLMRSWDAGAREFLSADGLLLVAAENFGAASGGIKNLLDRIYYPLFEAGKVLPYALVINAGNDGSGALRQVERIVAGLPWRRVTDPLLVVGEPDAPALSELRECGQTLAAGLALGVF